MSPATLSLAALVGACALAWLALDPHTPDLAAQSYRVALFHELGLAVWDDNWYAGHALPGYSLLYAPLAAALGMRVLALVSVAASSALFATLARDVYGPGSRWGAAWFALAALGDVWIGRLTFALGVALALAAALAFARGRMWWAALATLLCAAASPAAGALLGLAGLTLALARRSPRALAVLAGPSAALVAALALLFPEGGYEPFPLLSFVATMAVLAAFMLALPAGARLARMGGWVYLLACVACLLVRSPIGSNVARYGVLLAGPVLLCELARAGRRPSPLAAVALAGMAVWVVWGPARETLAVAGSEATSAAYYEPLERFLARASAPPAAPVRVEVPLTRSHWEAALLAPSVSLARGWDKQMETRYEGALLSHALDAASYERWLRAQAVAYVALPDVALDPSSAREGRLIEGGLPYLREVFASRHWRVYAVLGATALASGPGRLSALSHDSFALDARAAGRFVVRVHYTRYWTLTRGDGCVRAAPGGWTQVRARRPGTLVVSARFSLARALGTGGACSSRAGE